jgi:hypothetical protein
MTKASTWILLVAILSSLAAAKQKQKKPKIVIKAKHLQMCRGKPSLKTKKDMQMLTWLIEASGETSLLSESSPQHKSACWMLFDDAKQSHGRSKDLFLQRYALATLHVSSTKFNTTVWDWPLAADDPSAEAVRGHWGSIKQHECQWYGVGCDSWSKKVTALSLGFLKLDGIVPRELFLLPELRELDLHANDLQGILPLQMLDSLQKLEYFGMHMNGFFGNIPKEVTGMKNLKQLLLFGNYLSSTIPTYLAQLSKLEMIDLYANNLEGRIPSQLGSLKKLRVLDLHDNDLTGPMPKEICALKLDELVADCLGPRAEVQCDCCTVCCKGQMDGTMIRKCVDVKTGKEV